MSAMVKT